MGQLTGINEMPGETRDDVFYDNLAFHVAEGDGFRIDFHHPVWREAYVKDNYDRRHDWFMDLEFSGTTTTRPPLPVLAVAGMYKVFGWRWDVWRIAFGALNAMVLASLATWLARRVSLLAAVAFAATIAVDFSVMQSAVHLRTEPLAMALIAAMAWGLARLRFAGMKGTWFWSAFTGAAYGALILSRPNCVSWIPFALLAWGWLLVRPPAAWTRSAVLLRGLAFWLCVLIVVMPWWVRNSRASGHFNPLGSGASIGMSGAYCDESLNDYGRWQPAQVVDSQNRTLLARDLEHAELAEKEYWMGVDSLNRARRWAAENQDALPRLALYRFAGFWGLLDNYHFLLYAGNVALLLIALFGWTRLDPALRDFLALAVVATLFGVLVTWDDHGRYLIPLRPWIHLAAAVGIATLLRIRTRTQ